MDGVRVKVRADEEREHWDLLPATGVGPLRFGMSPAVVADALQVPAPRTLVGGPYAQEDFANGVSVFYDVGKLACVALDAAAGPQVFLAGVSLTGRDHEDVSQYLLEYAAEHGCCLLYTTDGSLSLTDLGLLLRSQQVGDACLSRPLIVIEEWLESTYYQDHLPLEGAPAARQ